ncbi:MAG: hypothetical protein ACFCUJ_05865 [Thiotrichales bacterium]
MSVIRVFFTGAGILALAFALSTAALARTPLPNIPAAKGDKCVEPTADIRKNHMKYLLHQRDATMHLGVRTKSHSLKGCIDCHVQPDAQGQYPAFGAPEHFCSACHNYAAVSIDCFQCHAHKPDAIGTQHSGQSNVSAFAADKDATLSRIHGRLSQLTSMDTRDD